MLIAKNVTKIYDINVHAVTDVSMEFETNHFYSIMGKSGSGKSTLLQLLSTLDTPTSGDVYIDNINTKNLNKKQLCKLRMNNIGFIFQSYYLHNSLTAIENILLPTHINPNINKKDARKKAEELIDLVGLTSRSTHLPKQLSGGEQQRIAIARSLINNPSYIFADEPTGNLDSENEKNIFKIIKDLSNLNKCIIVVSHNDLIRQYADTVCTMYDGVLKEESKDIL